MALQNNVKEDNQIHEGEAEIYSYLFAYITTLAIRTAIELRIADIIHSHGQPMTLPEIVSKIMSPSLHVTCLERLMRFLVRKKILTLDYDQHKQPLYGLALISKWLLTDSELSIASTFLTVTHPYSLASWYNISRSIKQGGSPFEDAHGVTFYEKMSIDPEFNDVFHNGMASVTKNMLRDILEGYKDGFSKLEGTIVDVGGGIGKVVSEIVRTHPHITGINFDLPHVIANARTYPGVTHVGGDMFEEIPKANTVFLKSVLHNWMDMKCIKILKNCQKAVLEKRGKVIIADVVLQPEGNDILDDARLALDLQMMSLFPGGIERTLEEWQHLLSDAGFASYNIISIPGLVSIIEAFV